MTSSIGANRRPPPYRVRQAYGEHEILLILCAVSIASLLVLPIAAFALATILLLNLPARLPAEIRIMLASVAAVAVAMMAGARPLDPNASNDIETYYEVYRGLASGDLDYLTIFGGGFEVGTPLLFWIWVHTLPELTVNGLMFCLSATASLLMLIWVEKSFYSSRGRQHAALMAACLLLLNLYYATQLSRQFLSLIVLLFAFTAQGRVRQLLWVTLAATFHLTAIPFFGLYLLARRGPVGWLIIVALSLALRLYFLDLLAALDIVPAALAEKLLYYVDNDQESSEADLGALRLIGLLGIVSLVALFASGFRPDQNSRPWLAIPWVTAAIHLLLLPIPLASLRVTLMIHSVVTGLAVYKMLEGRARSALPLVLNVLFAYKLIRYATAESADNLLPAWSIIHSFVL